MKTASTDNGWIDNIRKALSKLPNVQEKKMFGRIAFMVNNKLCITAGAGRMMLRIDAKEFDQLSRLPATSPVEMKNRRYKGFLNVDESALQTNKAIRFWVEKALKFNAQQLTKHVASSSSQKKTPQKTSKKR